MNRFLGTGAVLVLVAGVSTGGCRDEHYYGPYRLEVPTALLERAAGQTFRLPLGDADLRQLDELDACIEEQQQPDPPPRETPCICDHPVLTVDELQLRVDYQVTNNEQNRANVLVWVGVEAPPDEPDPDVIEDLPRVEILGEHHHTLAAGETLGASFLEEEMTEIDLVFATSRHGACEQAPGALPAPRELLLGFALESEQLVRLALELTVRVRLTD